MMKISLFIMLVIITWSNLSNSHTWHVPNDVTTIPAAMDSAVCGDSILVGPGTHYLKTLYVKDGIILTSESGPEDTEISPEPWDYPSHGAFYCVGLQEYTEISGFYIHPYSEGFIWDGSSCIWVSDSKNVCIKNNIIGSSYWSVLIGVGSKVLLQRNTLYMGILEVRFENYYLVEFYNNIFWCNTIIAGPTYAVCNDFKYANQIPGGSINNFSENPLFCVGYPDAYQYGLRDDSPCRPESTGCGLVGAMGVTCGVVPIKPVTLGELKSLFN